MRFINLTINDRNGERIVEYAFADDGKVLVDKDGFAVTSIERSRIDEFTEEDASLHVDLPPEEVLDILMGVSE